MAVSTVRVLCSTQTTIFLYVGVQGEQMTTIPDQSEVESHPGPPGISDDLPTPQVWEAADLQRTLQQVFPWSRRPKHNWRILALWISQVHGWESSERQRCSWSWLVVEVWRKPRESLPRIAETSVKHSAPSPMRQVEGLVQFHEPKAVCPMHACPHCYPGSQPISRGYLWRCGALLRQKYMPPTQQRVDPDLFASPILPANVWALGKLHDSLPTIHWPSPAGLLLFPL